MANHLRRQIREAIAIAVTGLPTTGARVYESRVYPLQDSNLPGLLVYTENETSERRTLAAPGLMVRTLRVVVRAVAKAASNLDDALDQICKEVEIALAMPNATVSMAKSITLVATDIEMQGTAEKPTGHAAMTYEVVYIAAENAPDVAQ
jgi:hypothetical protein